MIIYKHTNTITNKSYIGQTIKSLEQRWREHCFHFINDKRNTHFYNALKKYGTECWTHKILEEVVDINLLNEREVYWISFYNTFNNGYNSTSGGENGKIISNIIKQKIGNSNRNKNPSKEARQKMAIAKIGKKREFSISHRINMSKSRIGMIWVTNNQQSKRINKIDLDNYISMGYRKGLTKIKKI